MTGTDSTRPDTAHVTRAEALAPGFATREVDATSVARLADRDCDTPSSTRGRAAFASWLLADDRGFLQANRTEKQYEVTRDGLGYRRTIGVYDDTLAIDRDRRPSRRSTPGPSELTIPGQHDRAPAHAAVVGDQLGDRGSHAPSPGHRAQPARGRAAHRRRPRGADGDADGQSSPRSTAGSASPPRRSPPTGRSTRAG